MIKKGIVVIKAALLSRGSMQPRRCLLAVLLTAPFFLLGAVLVRGPGSHPLPGPPNSAQPPPAVDLNWRVAADLCKEPQPEDLFLQSMGAHGVPLVVLDPRVLAQFVPWTADGVPVSPADTNRAVTTFGLAEKDLALLPDQHKIFPELLKVGFEVVTEQGKHPETEEKVTTHLFYLYRSYLVHVVVLVTWQQVLWVAPVPLVPRPFQRQHLLLRGREGILRAPLRTEHAQACRQPVLVPASPSQFLREICSAHFVPCNASIARNFSKLFPQAAERNPWMESLFKAGLKELREILDPVGVDFWISSGTLLGWYRQCGLIPYTSDVDFTTWASSVGKVVPLEPNLKSREGLRLRTVYGLPEKAYQYAFYIQSLRIDLFFMYEAKDHFWNGGHVYNKQYFHYKYSKFALCSGILLGEKVLVPCNPQMAIQEEYGANWTLPVSDWVYDRSGYNLGPHIPWTAEERAIIDARP